MQLMIFIFHQFFFIDLYHNRKQTERLKTSQNEKVMMLALTRIPLYCTSRSLCLKTAHRATV